MSIRIVVGSVGAGPDRERFVTPLHWTNFASCKLNRLGVFIGIAISPSLVETAKDDPAVRPASPLYRARILAPLEAVALSQHTAYLARHAGRFLPATALESCHLDIWTSAV